MKLVGFQRIAISAITIGDRLRVVDPDHVAELKIWIEEGGLKTPVEVWQPMGTEGYRLIAGAHRIAACLDLGWTEIDAQIVAPETANPEAEAQLGEIMENLARHELNPLDRAANLFTLKDVWERLHPETKWGGKRKKGGSASEEDHQVATVATRFATAASAKTGMSERTVARAVALYRSITPPVRARIAGTELARKQGELVKLAELPPSGQVAVVEVVLNGANPITTVTKAIAALEGPAPANQDDADKALKRLQSLFLKSSKSDRRRFVQWLQDTGEVEWPDGGAA